MAKSKYESHVKPKLFLIENWAREGYTDEEIFKKLGISKDTFYQYKNKYTDFSDALKRGKEVVDYEVEQNLFKKTQGFIFEEEKEIIEIDTNGKKRKRIEKTKKWIPADTTAQIFWLKNRQSEKWRDKQDLNHSLNTKNIKINVDIEGVDDE